MRGPLVVCLAACGRFGFGDADVDGDARVDDTFIEPDWPNRPSTCTVYADTTLATAGWGSSGTVGMAVDADAPRASNVVEFVYDAGYIGGSAPGFLYFGDGFGPTTRRAFLGINWKMSAPWDGHESGFNGLFYLQLDVAGMTRSIVLTVRGAAEPYRMNVSILNVPYTPNVEDPIVTIGEWHRAEVLVELSTTDTSADGVLRWWHDGILVGDYTNISYPTLELVSFNLWPIWGGVGDAKTQQDYIRMDSATVCTE